MIADKRLILKNVIILVSVVSLLVAMNRLISVVVYFGGIDPAINNITSIYHLSHEGTFDDIPYLNTLSLVGVSLSGTYVAYNRRITLVGLLPFIPLLLRVITTLARARLVIGISLFISSYIYTNITVHDNDVSDLVTPKTFISTATAFLSLILISSYRGLIVEYGVYETKRMDVLRSILDIGPSIYVYLSSPIVVFSEYVRNAESSRFPGELTFAPLWRFLQNFGIGPGAAYNQEFFQVPINVNAATYLSGLYSDYKIIGLILGPIILSSILTIAQKNIREQSSILQVQIASVFMTVIHLSFFGYIVKLGYWFLPLVLIVLLAFIIDTFGYEPVDI